MKIPENELSNNEIIIKKEELCQKINQEFRKQEIGTKPITDLDRANAYQKKLGLCLEGHNKGGYYKDQLRELGIKYFDLNEDDSKTMNKQQLCEYIIPKVINIRKELGVSVETIKSSHIKSSLDKKNLSQLYSGKIEKCKESPGRGGINIKKLKKIAEEHFDIDITDMQKEEICDAIENKLREYQKEKEVDHEEEVSESILNLKDVDRLLDL